jgi:hypothetical protein
VQGSCFCGDGDMRVTGNIRTYFEEKNRQLGLAFMKSRRKNNTRSAAANNYDIHHREIFYRGKFAV